MSIAYRSSLTVLLLLLSCSVFAGILKGKVTDTKGEPLPFATVFIQGTTTGTTTNENGEYRLLLSAGTHKITCQFMGYKTATYNLTITEQQEVSHNFSLQEQSLEMKNLVVKANAEDPAYEMIRKTIKRRKFHLDQVRSFQSNIYLKGLLGTRSTPTKILGQKIEKEDLGVDSLGKGILYLCEEEADYYAEGGRKRTIIKAVRESGNPNGLGLSQMPPIVTFYENNVNIFEGINPRGFISPVSDNALFYYKYKYEGEFKQNGYTVDKIRVTAKRAYEPLVDGTIYIVEDDWAIYGVNFTITQKSNLEVLDTLRIEQVHLPLKKDTWVVKNQVLYPSIKIFGFDISGYFVTVYNQQKVNEKIPDSLFDNKTTSIYKADANKKDTAYWAENRPIPLKTEEVKDYVEKDSLRLKLEDPKHLDTVRRRGNKFQAIDLLLGGYSFATKGYKNRFSTNSLLDEMVNFNSVEGINSVLKLTWAHRVDTFNFLNGKFAARYGFGNQHFNGIGRLYFVHSNKAWRGKFWRAGIEGGKYVFQFNRNSTVSPFLNTFETLLYGQNYMKIYERWNGAVSFSRGFGNGLSFGIKADYQRRMPLDNTTAYTWSKSPDLTDNVAVTIQPYNPWLQHDAAILKIGITYKPGYTYTQYPDYKVANGSNMPLFTLQYEKGIPGIVNSVTDYDKWRFSVEDDMNLKLMGTVSYKIAAGGFLTSNYVALPDMMHISDNLLTYAAPYLNSFQLARYYKYSNTDKLYGEAHIEWALKGLLTNKIPLLRQARWYLVLGTNTYYAGSKNYIAEAFAGIDNLGYKAFRFLRVDFVHGWNQLDQTFYAFRIGIKGSGIINVNLRDNEDW
ncbi:MAG: carboxypeptidase-like regulatory domain-containing protein [Bacteroidetes bacterium]|nr:carboxypeptidase-like regulatory domain-containing protein [Bacteroidota bacterium]